MLSYLYSFTVWPCRFVNGQKQPRAVFTLFDHLGPPRVEMRFTEAEFVAFRAEVLAAGLTLREIERRLDVDPEIVS